MASSDRSTAGSENMIGEPLDTLQIRVNSKNGIQTTVSALHIGFMETKCYVQFRAPPIIKNDTGQDGLSADEEEWLETAAFFEDDLRWVLRLPYNRFWSQVIYDENLHKMLESYLSQAPRDYDLVHLHVKEELLCSLKTIHKLVFLVYLRMSTYKESKINHIRPEVFGSVIYDNFVFDVPKLMDICVLYGFQNSAIIQKIVQNIFETQSKYHEDLNKTSVIILEAFNTIEEKLSTNSHERKGSTDKDAVNHLSAKQEITVLPFHDVINYITDVSATLHAFLEMYSPACEAFFRNDGPVRIGTFYEQAFSMIEKEIASRKKQTEFERILEEVKRKVILSKTLLLKIFRNILDYCCIRDVLNSKYESKAHTSYESSHAEHFLEIFTVLASDKNFLHDYNNLYPFETDLELFNGVGLKLEPERLSYIFCSIHETGEALPEKFISSVSNGARPKIKKHTNEAVLTMQSVTAILKGENAQEDCKSPYFYSESSASMERNRLEDYEISSLIQAVKDVLPDLGDGFIEKCLHHFDYTVEKVIDALLRNDGLPSHILNLDRNLKREINEEANAKYSVLSERKNIYDNDEFDIFNRDDVDIKRVHMGKKNKTPSSYETLKNSADSEFIKEFTLNYGLEETEEELKIYEDEYDDTYDSAMVGLKEPAPEGEPETDVVDDNCEESLDDSKENTRDTSRDFCINPEISRERADQRRQAKMAMKRGGRRDGTINDQPQNRLQKDKNKAHVANHNRRKQADFKRSRGMGALPTR